MDADVPAVGAAERLLTGVPWPRAEPLTTRRLRLDPLTAEAAEEMVPVLADPALYAFTGGSPPSLAGLRRRYASQATGVSPDGRQGWLNWIVRDAATGRALGYVQATLEQGRSADLAWVIEPRSAGHGLATEAATAMLGWLREQGVGRVTAHIRAGHRASMRVAERLGLAPGDEVVDGERVWRAGPVSGGRP
jgi:RimJ/RimL family protein N-acetyltransferase